MELFDARPYLDFQHEYGPALLYLPTFLHRALLPTGLSLEASYYLWYFVCSVLGVWMIVLLLNQAVLPRGRKEIPLCVLGAAGLVPYMELNGNLVRYLPPYVSVVVAHRLMSRPRGVAWTILAVAALGSLNVVISPEIGVAFVVGWTAYCLFTAVIDSWRGMVAGSGLIVVLLLTALTLPREYAGSVFSFTGGAGNFPLVPAAHILFYLVRVFVTIPRLLADAVPAGRPEGALLFGLAAISVAMIPGALSRADPPTCCSLASGYHSSSSCSPTIDRAGSSPSPRSPTPVIVIGGLHVSNARSFYGVPLESVRPSHILALARSRGEALLTDADLGRLARYPSLGLPLLVRSRPANHGLSVVASTFRAGVLLWDHRRVL